MKAPGKIARDSLQYEYKHILHEPLMLQFNMLAQTTGMRPGVIAQKTGITTQTLRNWMLRKTKRPNSSTLRLAYKALGYTLKPMKD